MIDGNEFSKDLSLTLNGKQMDSRTIIVGNNGTTCFADALYSARSEEKVTPKPIEVIEVNGVDFSFKAGDMCCVFPIIPYPVPAGEPRPHRISRAFRQDTPYLVGRLPDFIRHLVSIGRFPQILPANFIYLSRNI